MDNADNILVVDDNPENLRVLSQALESAGYATRLAMTGEEALQSIEALPPEIVLLDIQLPKIDGYEVCRRIRAQPDSSTIPVLFISAASEAYNKLLAFQVGGNDYITKPFQTEEVLTRVKVHLQAARYRSSLEDHNIDLFKKYQNTFEQAAVGIAYVDPRSGRFNDVNQRLCHMLGYTRDELLAKTVTDITHEDFVEGDRQLIRDLTTGKRKEMSRQKQYLKRDGTFMWGKVTASLIKLSSQRGEEVHILVAMIEDITDRKRAEEERDKFETQLRQAQKLEAIGQLAGGVAHDLNNLLQVIMASGELALLKTKHVSPIHDELEMMLEAGNSAAKLVGQLLAFSRKQVLKREVLDLREVIEDLGNMINRLTGGHIELVTHSEPTQKRVHSDRGLIEQILLNLCVNASDAMPKGGILTIETKNIKIDESACQKNSWANPGDYIQLSVTDTGIGMDEETQQRIFEPFFTTKGEGKGTGLGLATVFGIVHQHNGMIQVNSELGLGTTFTIYLPVTDSQAQANEPVTKTSIPGGTETILLAEDNAPVRELACRILEKAGYTVLAAGDGEEAIFLFDQQKQNIDLALLDVVMPKCSGHSVFQHIQNSREPIPVLFVSGYSTGTMDTSFLQEEGMALIRKPFQQRELLVEVRRILDS